MDVFCDAQAILHRFERYVLDVRRLLLFHSLRCGSGADFAALRVKLEESKALRLDLVTLIRSVRDLEGGAITAEEMLTILALASGGEDLVEGRTDTVGLLRTVGSLRLLLAGVGEWSDERAAGDGGALPRLAAAETVLAVPAVPGAPAAALEISVAQLRRQLTEMEQRLNRLDASEPERERPVGAIEREGPVGEPEPLAEPPRVAADGAAIEKDVDVVETSAGPTSRAAPVVMRFARPAADTVSEPQSEVPDKETAAHATTTAEFLETLEAMRAAQVLALNDAQRQRMEQRRGLGWGFGSQPRQARARGSWPRWGAVAAVLALSAMAWGLLHLAHAGRPETILAKTSLAVREPASLDETPAEHVLLHAEPTRNGGTMAGSAPAQAGLQPEVHGGTQLASNTPAKLPTETARDGRLQQIASPGQQRARGNAATEVEVAARDQVPGRVVPVSAAVMDRYLIENRRPVMPPVAVREHLGGTVVVNAFVGKDGSVYRTDVVSGQPTLVNSAVAAISWRRYRPYLVHGQPVSVVTPVTVTYPKP